MKLEKYEPNDKARSKGCIVIEDLDEEQFFALMDEIQECMDMFKRWDKTE